MSGLDSTGFTRKTLSEIQTDLADDQKSTISASLNTEATSVLGVLNGIVANQLESVWELAESVYNGFNPEAAEGDQLDNLAALCPGTTRLAATQSTGTIACTGTALTSLPAGREVTLNGYTWSTDSAATITAASAWAATTAYSVGDYVENDTPDRIYICTTAGTSAGSGGPTGTGTAIADNTAVWRYVGAGAGVVEVDVTADDYGPDVVAYSYNVPTISTSVSGWEAAMFTEDADLGRNEETDTEFRARRQTLLAVSGSATEYAILAEVLSVSGVTQAAIYVNDTDVTDAEGVPPHGFELVVSGGTDNAVAQAIQDSKAAGIRDHGTSSGTATDTQDASVSRAFTRPAEVDIYVDVEVTTDSDYPADGDAQIKAALVAFGATLSVGDDVVLSQLYEPCFDVAGVTDVTLIEIGTAPAPSGTSNISITSRQVSAWDTSQITVTST